ncbi:hypothetical protein DB42_CR00330 [Neochlamydia sp. EPS4]|nr:hypothetical protein DB42_CR00330 [Neochlamydia sp. EPS4]
MVQKIMKNLLIFRLVTRFKNSLFFLCKGFAYNIHIKHFHANKYNFLIRLLMRMIG